MDLDIVLNETGQFGKYQFSVFFFLFWGIIYTSFYSISYVFTAGSPKYRCMIGECEGQNTSFKVPWLQNAIPFEHDEPVSCLRYKDSENFSNCSIAESFYRNETEKCDKYVFETDEVTIANTFSLYCENKWKLSFVGSINSIGQFIGMPLAGLFSDKFGRKTFIIFSTISSAIAGTVRSFTPNYISFLAFELIDAIVCCGAYGTMFVLAVELLGPEKRVMGSTLITLAYPFGETLMALAVWYFQDWRIYLKVIYLPGLLFIFYYWLVPESIRWLIANKRYIEAAQIINKISEVNKKPLSKETEEQLVDFKAQELKKVGRPAKERRPSIQVNIKSMFTSKIIMLRVIVCCFLWMTNTFVFYGLSLNSVNLAGNKYVSFILTSLAEIPGYLLVWLVLDKVGRRGGQSITLLITGIACVCFHFLNSDMTKIRLVLFLTGKCFITASFQVIYIFTSELFPTYVRNSVMGSCSMVGRIGNIIAPMTPLLADYLDPTLLFGGVSVTAGLLVLTLPETQNLDLPDTLEEAENIGNSKRERKVKSNEDI